MTEPPRPYCYLDIGWLSVRPRWVHWCLDHEEDTLLPLAPDKWSYTRTAHNQHLAITPSLSCSRCGTHGFWRDGWVDA